MIGARRWLVAAVLAIGLHAALFGLAIPSQELAMERSAGRAGAVWGLPMASIADVLEPHDAAPPAADPGGIAGADPSEATAGARVEPAEADQASDPAGPTEPASPLDAPAELVSPADTAEPVMPQTAAAEPSEAVAVDAWDGGIAVAEPVAAAETAASEPAEVRTAMLTPAADADAIAARDPVPLPMERPADVPRIEAAPARAKQAAVPATPNAARHAQPRPGETQPANRQETAARQPGARSAALASAAPAGEQVGSGGTRAADGGRAVLSSYAGRVAAHLQRYKRYPDEAARQRLAGTAVVTFTLGADGRVRASKLARASGQAVFDQEVLAMVQRASPFPPIPTESGRSDYTFTVPVHFKPR
jgi:protein TonB